MTPVILKSYYGNIANLVLVEQCTTASEDDFLSFRDLAPISCKKVMYVTHK